METQISRRRLLKSVGWAYAALACADSRDSLAADGAVVAEPIDDRRVAAETLDFITRCARADGSYAASPDADYQGNSDTAASDLAAATYAAVLAKTMGWQLPHVERSIEFVHKHQRPDGRFVNQAGSMQADDPLATLYNTTQGVVALRALGVKPKVDPAPALEPFFVGDTYKKLPWYTTSFFPLFYAALERPFPKSQREALAAHMIANQTVDGYLQDHVAATFHMVHYFRLLDQPTPKAEAMLARIFRDQKPDGGWNIKEPDWDVHACFDAAFMVRQLGGDSPESRRALERAARWALSCRNPDGGFGHFPGKHSDMDAVYFQFGTLVQAGRAPGARTDLADAHTLGWGHAIDPGKHYPTL